MIPKQIKLSLIHMIPMKTKPSLIHNYEHDSHENKTSPSHGSHANKTFPSHMIPMQVNLQRTTFLNHIWLILRVVLNK